MEEENEWDWLYDHCPAFEGVVYTSIQDEYIHYMLLDNDPLYGGPHYASVFQTQQSFLENGGDFEMHEYFYKKIKALLDPKLIPKALTHLQLSLSYNHDQLKLTEYTFLTGNLRLAWRKDLPELKGQPVLLFEDYLLHKKASCSVKLSFDYEGNKRVKRLRIPLNFDQSQQQIRIDVEIDEHKKLQAQVLKNL